MLDGEVSMKPFASVRALAIAAFLGGSLATVALAQSAPEATIHFGGGSVGFIAGVNWGGGQLHWHGRNIPLQVTGIGVGEIGATKYSADGEVFHLHRLSDINGTYTLINASATAGAGEGEFLDMRNQNGVEIRAHSTSAGLQLSLAPTGMSIHVKDQG
jgi:hypothetical protein